MASQRYPIPAAPPRYTDIRGWGWVPAGFVPYMLLLRLDRPTGYWLLFLPAGFALALSAPLNPGVGLLGFFGDAAGFLYWRGGAARRRVRD